MSDPIDDVLDALPETCIGSGCFPPYYSDWEGAQKAREIARQHDDLNVYFGKQLQDIANGWGAAVMSIMQVRMHQEALVKAMLALQEQRRKRAAGGEGGHMP